MKLPIKLPFQKQDDAAYYLSLLIGDEKAHATVFAEKNGKIEIIGEHEEHFPTPVEKLSDEALLDILDKTISNAEATLPEGFQTRKTIFGVKENWIEETKIKKEYLNKLKKVCDSLGLTPIGFLVIHEAVAHLLQKEEGAPVSAILTEIGTDDVAVSLLRAGKILETHRVKIETSIPHTIDKTLHQFSNYEILPSRIIVFNDHKHPKLSQELTTHQWSKSLPFLHVPQIKILPPKFEARAILFGAATQMGFEVLDKFDMPTIPNDISKEEPSETPKEDMFGFVSDADVAKKEAPIPQDTAVETYNETFYESEHEEPLTSPHHNNSAWQTKLTGARKTTKHFLTTLSAKLPLHRLFARFPQLEGKKGIIFIPPAIVGIVLLLFLLYIFTLKATVVLSISPKTVEENQNVLFSTNQITDVSQSIIAAQSVSTSQEGSMSTPATGKKEIGEKAKGAITLYNSTTKEQNVAKGTIITSANNLQFVLDDTVKIASSGGASDGSKTAKGSVTAGEIGKEFNLPSGTKFTVGGFGSSEVEGKNESAFSGGSKKEITVVAKADTAKLLDGLPKQLQEKAKDDLKSKLSANQSLLPVFLTTAVDKKSFDKDVGEEATSVNLDATVSFTSATYSKKDLEKFILDLLSKQDPNLSPSKETLSYTIDDVSEDNGDISAKLQMKGFLVPKIEKEKVAQNIAGKSFDEAESILIQLPQVKNTEVKLSPNIPLLPSLLPRLANNITIEIQTHE